jgi:hypothetical protein
MTSKHTTSDAHCRLRSDIERCPKSAATEAANFA